LCTVPQIEKFVFHADLALYQAVLDYLIPDLLAKSMSQMSPRLRCFGDNAEMSLQKAMHGAPDSIQKVKRQLIQLLVYCLKRFTSINHLSYTARRVVDSKEQMAIMYKDYCKIIGEIPIEAFWVTNAENSLVQSVNDEFKEKLRHITSLEDWMLWLEGVLTRSMSKYNDKSLEEQSKANKQFLLCWNYFSDSIVCALTMKSADSFGSFHVFRVLCKDYLFYLVQKRLACVSKQPIIYMFLDYFQASQQQCVVKFEESNSIEYELMEPTNENSGYEIADAKYANVNEVSVSISLKI
jgi:regulatory factor X 1/2/3